MTMPTFIECEHGGDPHACPPCNADQREPLHDVGPVFTARWPGWCPTCKTTVDEGDQLRMVDGYAWCRPCADVAEHRP